jgi:ABC-type glycerol-3-phosphate transport system substrate-binding protein
MHRRISIPALGLALLAVFATGLVAAGPSRAADNELVVAVWTSPEAENLKRFAPVFTRKTGIRVEIDEVARDAYRSKVSTTLLSRAPAWDVVWMIGDWVPEFAKAGALTPADTLLAKEQLAELKGLETSTFEGRLWGLPTEYHPVYLWYRPSLLKAAGVEVPQTWDEYLAALRKLQKVDPSGKVERYGTVLRTGVPGVSVSYEFSTFFLGFGATWLDADNRPVMNSPQGVAALKYFVDVLRAEKLAPPDSDAIGYLEKNQYFQSERAAMMLQWSAAYDLLTSCEKSPKICQDVAIGLVPGRREGGAVKRGVIMSAESWVVPASSTRKEAARAFLGYLASKEGATAWALNGGDPVHRAVYSDPEVLRARKDFPLMAETMAFAKLPPRIPHTAQLIQVWARELNLAANLKKSPEAALNDCAAEWTRILKEGGYLK